jgi:hypothetical protein
MDVSWMIGLLIFLLVACIVLWAARKLMAAWAIGEPIATTVYVVLVVVFAIAFVMRLGHGIAVW